MYTCRHERRLLQVLQLARNHEHKKALVACRIYKGSRVVSNGLNGRFNHAERVAVSNASSWDLEGCVAYVARSRKDGSPGLARPCSNCRHDLMLHNVTRVYYTTDNGYQFESWK